MKKAGDDSFIHLLLIRVVEQRGLVDDAPQSSLRRFGEPIVNMFVGLFARFSYSFGYALARAGAGSFVPKPLAFKQRKVAGI